MHTEYEVRILEVDKQGLINKLEKLNANFVGDFLQRRYVYDFKPKELHKWIRLRTNGKITTLTIKDIASKAIDGTKELEVEVSDFDETNLILEKLGYTPKGYQENRRCRYILNGVEIDIDDWPMIPTYLEIEGKSADDVYRIVEMLGYKKEDTTTLDCEGIYLDYGYDIESIYELKLEEERK